MQILVEYQETLLIREQDPRKQGLKQMVYEW